MAYQNDSSVGFLLLKVVRFFVITVPPRVCGSIGTSELIASFNNLFLQLLVLKTKTT